jgi:hypothetical protein
MELKLLMLKQMMGGKGVGRREEVVGEFWTQNKIQYNSYMVHTKE